MRRDFLQHVTLELTKELLQKNETIPLKTFGASMGYTIRNGEWIVVQRTSPDKIRLGDIVIYQSDRLFVAHRLIRRYRENHHLFVLTKGDANLTPDKPLQAESILAKVIALKKPGGTINLNTLKGKAINRLITFYSLLVYLSFKLLQSLHLVPKDVFPDKTRSYVRRSIYKMVCLPVKIVMTLSSAHKKRIAGSYR